MGAEEKLWLEAKSHLRQRLPEDVFNRWLGGIVPLRLDKGVLWLGVPDPFFADWVANHYGRDIEAALAAAGQPGVRHALEPGHMPTPAPQAAPAAVPPPLAEAREPLRGGAGAKAPNCNARFTFDSFVVGDGNRFAFAAAKAVSQEPGRQFNPLFIYSSPSLGKTHLLQAIANSGVSRKGRPMVVEYQTCEKFLNLYVEALEHKRLTAFREHFRRIDMLLVDDIHFMSDKTRLQEEFFNTFNTLHNNEKQIVLASDRPPAEINGLESRLVSRFQNGLIVDIQPPDMETRLAILRRKQEDHAVKLSDQVLSFIATRITRDIRKLEGALLRLTAYSSISGEPVTLETAECLLRADIMQEEASKVSMDLIIRKVAEVYDLRVAEMVGKKRPKNIAIPRMVAIYLARELTDASLNEIGDAFGGRNHATVLHAIDRIKAERLSNPKMEGTISMLLRQLKGQAQEPFR